jgi:hypothetical protein
MSERREGESRKAKTMNPGTLPKSVLKTCAVVAAAAALLIPATSAEAAGAGSLAGTWTSTDTDGSQQTLDIRGSGNFAYSMVYVDVSATVCGGDPARLSGPGYVDGDSVLMVAVLVCQPGGNVLKERLTIGFQHDTATHTLTDDFGIVWHRAS